MLEFGHWWPFSEFLAYFGSLLNSVNTFNFFWPTFLLQIQNDHVVDTAYVGQPYQELNREREQIWERIDSNAGDLQYLPVQ